MPCLLSYPLYYGYVVTDMDRDNFIYPTRGKWFEQLAYQHTEPHVHSTKLGRQGRIKWQGL